MGFLKCPRCGDRSYEILKSYAHCISCNYSPEFERAPIQLIPNWVIRVIAEDSHEVPPIADVSRSNDKLINHPISAA